MKNGSTSPNIKASPRKDRLTVVKTTPKTSKSRKTLSVGASDAVVPNTSSSRPRSKHGNNDKSLPNVQTLDFQAVQDERDRLQDEIKQLNQSQQQRSIDESIAQKKLRNSNRQLTEDNEEHKAQMSKLLDDKTKAERQIEMMQQQNTILMKDVE